MDTDSTKKDLIRKYLNQRCTPSEIEELKKLMNTPGIELLFDEVLSETWTGLEPEHDVDQPRLNQQLNKFYSRVNEHAQGSDEQRSQPALIRVLKNRKYLSYAAIWVVAIMGFIAYRMLRANTPPATQQVAMREITNPYGRRSKIVLPDSSEVYLGAGSKLTVPESFTGNTRTISLAGEAFFQVTKNPKRPFIIHTGTIQTRVLGTSFKIEAFDHQAMTVAVATGKVRVDQYANGKHISLAVLTPGQKMTYDNGQASVNPTTIDDVKSWKDGRLVFKNQRLSEITAVLERWYNVKFQYKNPAKADERITVRLQGGDPLERIMKVLSATGHFKFSIEAEIVRIN